MSLFAVLSLLSAPAVAAAVSLNETFRLLDRAPNFEWTAWGDSYASGVGAGKYIDGRRCLRYDNAYPSLISADPDNLLEGGGGKFNNVVCSGATSEEVLQYQFYTEDQYWGQPNWTYYPRKSSGKPTLGTVTVGGDDIDFPGILSNCIMEGFPWPLSRNFPPRSCDDQRDITWSLIAQDGTHATPNTDLVNKIDSVLKKIVEYGRGATGDSFRLYATGYPEFFNDQDPGCDGVTFARNANPTDDGKPHNKLTTELRADFNAMSRLLNKAVQQAVDQNSGSNVKFIDIDTVLTDHRFCEAGVNEPDQNRDDTWFFHYPYNQGSASTADADASDPTIANLNSVADKNANSINWDPKTTRWVDFMNDFWSKVDENELLQAVGATSQEDAVAFDLWESAIGVRVKLFHPKPAYHRAIYNAIIDQYKSDISPVSSPPQPNPPISSNPGYASGTCHMQVNEWEIGCEDESNNLTANITIYDNNSNEIGSTSAPGPEYYPSIDPGNTLQLKSNLSAALEVTGYHSNDTVQFTLLTDPPLSWSSQSSQQSSPDAFCTTGTWNPSSRSSCRKASGRDSDLVPFNAKIEISCFFKC